MADWLEAFQVTIPAGVAPPGIVYTIRFSREGYIEEIEIIIPDGVNGVVGFQLMFAGTVVLPLNQQKYIVGNNEKITWRLFRKYTSGDWAVRAYNQGVFEHTLYLRFLVVDTLQVDSVRPVTSGSVGSQIMTLTG